MASLVEESDGTKAVVEEGTKESAADSGAGEDSEPSSVRVCATPDCGKPATMACPTCLKLSNEQCMPCGFEVSLYCEQACFKAHWPVHKQKHTLWKAAIAVQKGAMPAGFEGYNFTGSLRPAPYGPSRMGTVPKSIKYPDYAVGSIPISEREDKRSTNRSIRTYTPAQIAGIRNACRIGREVLDIGGRAVRAGVTCDEIDRVVHEASVERGAYPSPLNYYKFPRSVCTSVNEVICHGIPDCRPLVDGDIVNIDVTTYVVGEDGVGYHGDLNETFLVGNVDAEGTELVRNAFSCLATAVDMVKPGAMFRDLGANISKTAASSGFSVVRSYCGHGIGDLFHTAPNVPHYPKNKAKGVMKPGMIFTIEPMINVGSWRDVTWPDDWTAVTADGSRSAQFEHTLLVTDSGYEILTQRQGEPKMEWSIEKVQR